MPWYRKHGKILTPLSDVAFAEGMEKGHFVTKAHRAFPVLLRYSAVRKMEALRATRDQFATAPPFLYFDVGPRLKKIRHFHKGRYLTTEEYDARVKKLHDRITTPPIPLPIDAPYMDELVQRVQATAEGERVFPWSPKTAYNIIDRVFAYPHLFRLSLITWFFMPHPEVDRPRGFSIPEVRTFTGLSLAALDFYIGRADVADMGRSMYLEQRGKKNGGE